MIGLIMAGGKGSRMNIHDEKLLLKYKQPVILHVVKALQNSNCFSKIIAATSNNSPKTKKLLQENNVETIDTQGNGYVNDLNHVLQTLDDDVFVASGDLPLLDEHIVKQIIDTNNSQHIWISYVVTKDFLELQNLSAEYSIQIDNQTCHFTGISIVKASQIQDFDPINISYVICNDKRIGFNLNTDKDYDLLCAS